VLLEGFEIWCCWGVTPLEIFLEGRQARGRTGGRSSNSRRRFFFFFLCLKKRWSPGCEFWKELGIWEKAGISRVCQILWPWICRMEQRMLGEEAGVVDLWL
jgi:hypothetical protein